MPIGYQRGDKETLKKFSRNDEDFRAGLSCASLRRIDLRVRVRVNQAIIRGSFEQACRLFVQQVAPLTHEIHDGEGNRQDA